MERNEGEWFSLAQILPGLGDFEGVDDRSEDAVYGQALSERTNAVAAHYTDLVLNQSAIRYFQTQMPYLSCENYLFFRATHFTRSDGRARL